MKPDYCKIRPAALSRQILSLTGRLETLVTAKQPAPVKPLVNENWNRRPSRRYSNELMGGPTGGALFLFVLVLDNKANRNAVRLLRAWTRARGKYAMWLSGRMGCMCGRYVVSKAAGDLLSHFEAKEVEGSPPRPSWNVAPTQSVPIIAERLDEDTINRHLLIARWGLGPVLSEGHQDRLQAD